MPPLTRLWIPRPETPSAVPASPRLALSSPPGAAVGPPATETPVCRTSITAPGAFPGCQPLNILGQNNATAASQQYVFGNTSWQAKNKMDDFSANLTGTVLEGWAGPIKTAVGLEYRHRA